MGVYRNELVRFIPNLPNHSVVVRQVYTYSEGTLEGDLVLLDVLNGKVGDGSLAVLEDGGDVDRLPGNGSL